MRPLLAIASVSLAAALAAAGCGTASSPTRPNPPRRHAVRPVPRRPARRRAHLRHPPPSRATAPPRASAALVEHGPRTRRWIALTFDADMTPGMLARLRSGAQRSWYDARIVRELHATRTPATVFLTGLWTTAYPHVVRRLAHDPLFELENHSWDHFAWRAPCYGLPVAPPARHAWEVRAAAREIRAVAGVAPRWFRFPGGCGNAADRRLVARLGEQPLGWDVDSGDAFQPSPEPVIANVLARARPGSIVVMHFIGAPNAPATAAVLQAIIPALRARGYRFVTLRRLLGVS
jgi:peptidoglycan-N-acetylglucosamine deacetylase